MRKYGESYASALYIMAALTLALSGSAMSKIYDQAAGTFYFLCDITILILQLLNRFPKIRTFLLFGGSLAGSFILLVGGFMDDLHNAHTTLEWAGAAIRCVSNFILVFASFAGVMTLFPKVKIGLPEKPGIYYLASYFLFFLFAIFQFVSKPSIMSSGYIFATILWLLAANAIRLKYDDK